MNLDDWFENKIKLICDPYFDREFFTNLIFCIDRKKTLREIFEASLREVDQTGEYTEDVDRCLLHFFYAYQAAHYLRENYQHLALAQGLYTMALFRSDGKYPLELKLGGRIGSQAATVEEFRKSIRLEVRRVSSFDAAWASLLFLMENRSTRAQCLEVLIETCIREGNLLTTELLLKSIDLSFSTAWKKTEFIMKRAFECFWEGGLETDTPDYYSKALGLLKSRENMELKFSGGKEWKEEWAEELWHRMTKESVESAWEWIAQICSEGATYDQLVCALHLARGRALFTMRASQWPIVTESLLYASALEAAGRWVPSKCLFYIALSLCEFIHSCQLVQSQIPGRPDGSKLPEGFSKNISKNQLVLRLDDATERGDHPHALELIALLVRERSLSHHVSDRLVLMASKQDGWTYKQMSIPTAFILAGAYEDAVRLKLSSSLCFDALYGLLRFLSDQRQEAVEDVKRTGNYGDGGLYHSPFDVSSGARIVHRYVFNQMRNAQRIFIWPTEGKG